ncbi:MAG: DUF4351 domain-containing protein [Polyangiaceae bacterium]|nr:DUF4351 domain-containing protein [Polyangiaceae bacterium]
MVTRYDQLGKQMLRASLQERGSFTSELEVSPDPQQVDGYFVPDLERPSPVAGTLLGRMTERPCSFEVFSAPPDVLDVEGCIRKHLNLRHILRKQIEAPGLPHQWILSAGKPSKAFDATWARVAETWPCGVYEQPPVNATSIVVLSDLPEERSTLLLRLMGRGRTLKRAIEELKSLSNDEFEKCIALPILVRYRIEAVNEPASPADEEFLMNTQEIMDMYERRAELRGKLQGRRETVQRLLRRKFGVLPEDVVTRVENADAQLLDQLEEKVLYANSLDEVFAS